MEQRETRWMAVRNARWFIAAGSIFFAATILVMLRLWWPSGIALAVSTALAVFGLRLWLRTHTITGQVR